MPIHHQIKLLCAKGTTRLCAPQRLNAHLIFNRPSSSSIDSNPWHSMIPEHAEFAQLTDGQRWEFRAGAMARLASGSVVLSINEDNAILGTVVCKHAEKLLDEEGLLRELEEKERAEAEAAAAEQGEEALEEMTAEEEEEADNEFAETGGGRRRGAKQQQIEEQQQSTTESKNIPQLQGVPFSVDFRQSAAALGRIPMNYFRREMQHNDQDVATSRIIDRSLRPIINPHFPGRTHIVCKPLALDDVGDTAIMGINVASAALAVSPVPQLCLVAAARVGIIDGKVHLNPPREQLKHSTLDLVLTGTTGRTQKDSDDHVLMVEMEGKEVELDQFVECIQLGFKDIRLTQSAIQRLADAVGHQKYKVAENAISQYGIDLFERAAVCEGAIEAILTEHSHSKHSRGKAVEEVFQGWSLLMRRQPQKYSETLLRAAFTDMIKRVHRRVVLDTGLRIDGRRSEDFRPIQCRVDLYRKLHGSALFQRGQSQVLSTVTFDSPQAAFHPDAIAQLLGAQRKKSFMLHYEFPQFATNEIEFGSGSNRREIGHGLLAEKALRQVMPDDFPYTIRLACQVLESNGSTSMASVCAGSMALYDAGIPLMSNHVAGLAMGLITEQLTMEEMLEMDREGDESIVPLTPPQFPGRYKLLTDLAGFEDFSGDMDFKIAGTSRGFTAMQMDLKICGLPLNVFREALSRSRVGLEHVLGLMRTTIPEPRSDFKPTVPIIELLQLAAYKRPILFRSGAYNAKLIEAETGVKVTSEDDSNISLFAPNAECLDRAKQMIAKLMEEQQDEHYQFGAVYKAKITRILEGGVHVTLKEGSRPIWIRNADLSSAPGRKNAIALGLEVDQFLSVQYFGRDQHTGQHRLTRKTLQILDPPVQNLFRSKGIQQREEEKVAKKDDGENGGKAECTG